MLSNDELTNGRTFMLKLWNAAGVSSQWVETLRGDTARRWYDVSLMIWGGDTQRK